jgi:lysophospholipase L1-like esterase
MPNRKVAVVAFVFVIIASTVGNGQPSNASEHWVSAWSTAVQTPPPFPGLPPVPVFDNQTVRMVIHSTIGGDRVRVRLSNAFGTAPLKIGTAQVAFAGKDSTLLPNTIHALTFNGAGSVNIPAGASILSDAVSLRVTPLSELAVSLFIPETTTASTVHFWGQHETYISEPGDFTAKAEMPIASKTNSWYFLADVEVLVSSQTGATVTLGDSITDGAGAKQGDYTDWPDLLASRLVSERQLPGLAIVNEGIGGNRILYDGAGVNALARFDRDVLAQPGVVNLIILEGINDIGWPHMKPRKLPDGTTPRETPFARQLVTATELIAGLTQIIERARQHGIRVFGATLTPYQGADYYTDDGEATRQQVNQWIRTSGVFDGMIDFDAAVRDAEHPGRLRGDCDSGDHLHPSAAGYKAMAAAVDLKMLRATTAKIP